MICCPPRCWQRIRTTRHPLWWRYVWSGRTCRPWALQTSSCRKWSSAESRKYERDLKDSRRSYTRALLLLLPLRPPRPKCRLRWLCLLRAKHFYTIIYRQMGDKRPVNLHLTDTTNDTEEDPSVLIASHVYFPASPRTKSVMFMLQLWMDCRMTPGKTRNGSSFFDHL